MTGVLISLHDATYEQLGNITWKQNKLAYARRWGYDAICKTNNIDKTATIGFAKIDLMLEVANFNRHDWLFWSGCDTLITNFNIPLTDMLYPDHSIFIATDFNGLQSDSFLIRNDVAGRKYLNKIMDMMPEYAGHPWAEQQAMIDIGDQFKSSIKILPQKFINSFPEYLYVEHLDWLKPVPHDQMGFLGRWRKGDFLVHFASLPLEKRIELATEYLNYVIL